MILKDVSRGEALSPPPPALPCVLCGSGAGPCSRVASLGAVKSQGSGTSLLALLKKVVSGGPSLRPQDAVCEACCSNLRALDQSKTRFTQLQDHLLSRYRGKMKSTAVSSGSLSHLSTINSTLPLDSGTMFAVTPSLSVTVMREPPPKRRRTGITEEEFLNPSDPGRRHRCDYSCPFVSPRLLTDLTNRPRPVHDALTFSTNTPYSSSSSSSSSTSIKCSVGDLDKSHISDILRTPTRVGHSGRGPNSAASPCDAMVHSSGRSSNGPGSMEQSGSSSEPHGAYFRCHLFDSGRRQHTSAGADGCAGEGSVQRGHNDVMMVNMLQDSDDDSGSEYSSSSGGDSDEGQLARQLVGQQPQHVHQVSSYTNTGGSSPGLTAATHALLLSNPEATSLLHSFLATSLWLHGGGGEGGGAAQQQQQQQLTATAVQEEEEADEDADPQHEQTSDDVTCESLSAVPGVQDKNTRQELKNTGQSYINTKGKMVEARRVAPQDCSKCVMRCSSKLSEADRQSVFAEYWGLADYNKQREYLAEHMHREEKLGPSGLTRTVVLYYLTHKEKVQVCRQFFLKTLDVSEKASRIVLEKKVRGEFGTIGAPPPAPTHRTTSSRSRRTVANNQDSDYEY